MAQRRVYDAVKRAGGVHAIHLSSSLMASVRSARARYQEHLETKQAQKVQDEKKMQQKESLKN